MTQLALFHRVPPEVEAHRDGVSLRTVAERRLAAMRLGVMHQRHGAAIDGSTCGGCDHLVAPQHGARRHFKCALFGSTRSEATDWRAKWPACGRFTPREVVARG